jgi:NSS family neurotransmitter:Na+ symporter
VLKYCVVFISGQGLDAANDSFFTSFITNPVEPIIFLTLFLAATCFVVYRGVNKGIESMSKILMPILLVLIVGVAVYSLTISGGENTGGRTGIDGLLIYIIPNFEDMTIGRFIQVVMDAMGQLFYSISVAMGIMVAYGSYCKDDSNLMKSVNQIEFFDTIVAFLAGVMIIPAVFVFLGTEGLENAGPGLMFVALPQVFARMGVAGRIVGSVFFLMVLFAALTSSVSILEAVTSSIIDKTKIERKKASVIESVIGLVLGVVVCFGYTFWYFEAVLPNTPAGKNAQILDIFDYLSNNVLMPIVAIGTCVLIGWVVKPKYVIDEVTKNGEKFRRKHLYIGMVKVVAPVMLLFLLLASFGIIK